MNSLNFDNIANDTQITGIGRLFRGWNESPWNISLHCYPFQPKTYLSMSHAPILARKRTIKPTQQPQRAGRPKIIKISNNYEWYVKRIGSCPIKGYDKRSDADQYCFAFMTERGLVVYIPQFELARALFFHNSYLSVTAPESRCLDMEFAIDHAPWSNHATIRVMPTSGYPLSLLCDPASRKHLSWILLDESARQSFQSISTYQYLSGRENGRYRVWDFQFNQPNLSNVWLDVHGHYDQYERTLFVYEIDAIRGLARNIPENITFIHPDFEISIPGTGDGRVVQEPRSVSRTTIHDGATAKASSQPIVIDAPKVDIEFDKPISTTIVPARERIGTSHGEENEEICQNLSVSMEEGSNHGLPQATWQTTNDVSDDTPLFKNKFKCFLEMIDVLILSHGCTLRDKQIRKLPKLKRCKKHLLSTDGSPRHMAVIELEVQNKLVHLLEVDTSDADKALSTQVLSVRNQCNWDIDLINVEKELVKTSLCWPQTLLTEICGKKKYQGVPHPHSPSSHRGVLSSESVTVWPNRMYEWMLKILNGR